MDTNAIDRDPPSWTPKSLALAIVGGLGFIAFAWFVVTFTWAIAGS